MLRGRTRSSPKYGLYSINTPRTTRRQCAGGSYGEIVTTIFPKVRFCSMSVCAWRICSKA